MASIRLFDQTVRAAGAPNQVVDVVQALGQVVLLAPGAAARDPDDAPVDEARELGAASVRIESGSVRDLLRGGWLPQVGERQVDPPLLRRQRFDVALEVLRVVVHQVEQIRHQRAKGQPGPEAGHDGEQTRAAAGEGLQRPDRLGPGISSGQLVTPPLRIDPNGMRHDGREDLAEPFPVALTPAPYLAEYAGGVFPVGTEARSVVRILHLTQHRRIDPIDGHLRQVPMDGPESAVSSDQGQDQSVLRRCRIEGPPTALELLFAPNEPILRTILPHHLAPLLGDLEAVVLHRTQFERIAGSFRGPHRRNHGHSAHQSRRGAVIFLRQRMSEARLRHVPLRRKPRISRIDILPRPLRSCPTFGGIGGTVRLFHRESRWERMPPPAESPNRSCR